MPAEQAVHTSESAEPLSAEPATQTHVAAAVPLLESAGQAVQLVAPAMLYVFAKHAGLKTSQASSQLRERGLQRLVSTLHAALPENDAYSRRSVRLHVSVAPLPAP